MQIFHNQTSFLADIMKTIVYENWMLYRVKILLIWQKLLNIENQKRNVQKQSYFYNLQTFAFCKTGARGYL